jgi:putative SOS response-associated peptidase YedK
MPAMLDRNAEAMWLNPATHAPDLIQLLGPYPEDERETYRVSKAVNSPGKEEAEMVEPLVGK